MGLFEYNILSEADKFGKFGVMVQFEFLTPRLTNGFSKKIENHGHAVALHYIHYNFRRAQQMLRVTPAMEAGIADHVWSKEELVSP